MALAEGDYERALGHLQQAEQFDAERPGLLLQIAEAYLRLRRIDRAEQTLVRAEMLDPDRSRKCTWDSVACRCLDSSTLPPPKRRLRAVGLGYSLPMAHYLLGRALFRWGRTLQAVEALHVALSINPHFAEAHRLLAVIYRNRLGEFEQARRHRQLAREMQSARERGRRNGAINPENATTRFDMRRKTPLNLGLSQRTSIRRPPRPC